jgi:hypothetical protein
MIHSFSSTFHLVLATLKSFCVLELLRMKAYCPDMDKLNTFSPEDILAVQTACLKAFLQVMFSTGAISEQGMQTIFAMTAAEVQRQDQEKFRSARRFMQQFIDDVNLFAPSASCS